MEIDPSDNGERHGQDPVRALGAQDVGVTRPWPPAVGYSNTMRSPAVAGMHTPVSLVSTYPDMSNATRMLDEETNDEEHDGDDLNYGGEYEDYGDAYIEDDCPDGEDDAEMVDGFLNGEEDRKYRSKVWNEFIKIRVAGVVVKGKCKHCGALITAKRGDGTSAMRTHLKRCKVRKTVVDVVSQLNATIMSPQGFAMKDWRFNQEKSRIELLRMIVLHELPLSIVEYDGFRRFVSSLNPVFRMVSRKTITLDCLASFHDHKQKLQEALKNFNGRVSLTMDMWTSNQTLGYMCITCHCVDDDWKLHKRILMFSFLKTPHTGIALFNAVLKSSQEWNIEGKLFAITLDNASNNNRMMKLLKKNLEEKQMLVGKGRLLHQRCAAHVLNLICQAGFEILKPIIEKIRESVKYVQGSPSRKQKFEEIVQQLGISAQKHPQVDVSTRWNSTYHMVEDAMEFKRAFESLTKQDPEYTTEPSPEDWKQARLVGALLKVFCDATSIVSGTLYPTSNLHFHEIWEVKMALEAGIPEMDAALLETISYMRRKFKRYWKMTWLQISIPVLLDPRFKLGFIEFRLGQAFGNEAASKIAHVKKVFLELFKDYSQANVGSQVVTQQGPNAEPTTHANQRFSDWDNHVNLTANSTNEVPTELEVYFGKPAIPRGDSFDILAWWKSNSLEYPTLSRIARDILAVPASTVASESAFSTSGRVISDSRSRLNHGTVEALICLQDWLRASGSSQPHMEALHDTIQQAAQLE